jgi:hypothetical protein
MTRERAAELTRRVPLRASFAKRYRRCGGCSGCNKGPGHGPYWFAEWRDPGGRSRSVYLGSDDKKREMESAHAIMRAELQAAERAADATPEVARLHALQRDTQGGSGGIKRAREREETAAIRILPLRVR